MKYIKPINIMENGIGNTHVPTINDVFMVVLTMILEG